MNTTFEKAQKAIKFLQSYSRTIDNQPIEVAYSGGKDSDVILRLVQMAGIPYEAIYKNTTIDPKGTIKHAKEKGVKIMQPKMTFLEIISKKGYPNRWSRTCCNILKEYKIKDWMVIGIRREESVKRKERYKEPTLCRMYAGGNRVEQIFPILEWNNEDVKTFVEGEKIKCHPLYYDDNGNFCVERRLGCLGCPLASKTKRVLDLKENPAILKMYLRGGKKFLERGTQRAKVFRNEFEYFLFNVFFENYNDFFQFREGLFGSEDCKKIIEKKFDIIL